MIPGSTWLRIQRWKLLRQSFLSAHISDSWLTYLHSKPVCFNINILWATNEMTNVVFHIRSGSTTKSKFILALWFIQHDAHPKATWPHAVLSWHSHTMSNHKDSCCGILFAYGLSQPKRVFKLGAWRACPLFPPLISILISGFSCGLGR